MVKMVVLMDNTACEPEFASEHGLSLYLETNRHKILFDSGQTAKFAENALRLGIDLSKADTAVLSHGHYDHGGGLEHFLQLNNHASIYLNRCAFGQYYHGAKKYIGIAQELKHNGRLIFAEDMLKIDEELELCTCNGYRKIQPIDSAGLTERKGAGFAKDIFAHEQYLILHDGNRRIVFSGCSHKGVINIMEWLKPDIFVGGFHFMQQEFTDGRNAVLDEAAKRLLSYDTVYYTCHCTGLEQYWYMKEKMGDRLCYISAGQNIIL